MANGLLINTRNDIADGSTTLTDEIISCESTIESVPGTTNVKVTITMILENSSIDDHDIDRIARNQIFVAAADKATIDLSGLIETFYESADPRSRSLENTIMQFTVTATGGKVGGPGLE